MSNADTKSITATVLDQLEEMEKAGQISYWHNDRNESFITFEINGRYENHALKSSVTRMRFSQITHSILGKALNDNSYRELLPNLEGKCLFSGSLYEDRYRVGRHENAIYIDLGNKDWGHVKVTPEGWEVNRGECPVKFRRASHTRPLPYPTSDPDKGRIDKFLNLSTEEDILLLHAFFIQCFSPEGPYPLLSLTGEQGSAKSSAARFIVSLTDPKAAPLRAMPGNERDLMIDAEQSQVLAYDNISYIKPDISDALCRLSTGGGFSTRALYTDSEQVVFESSRPVILTGINESVTRSDLVDRTLSIQLKPINPSDRVSESFLNLKLENKRPYIFASLLDTLAGTMGEISNITLKEPPRMIDFARMGEAVAKVLGRTPGSFVYAYNVSQSGANENIVDSSPIGEPLRKFIKRENEWCGINSDLLYHLNYFSSEEDRKRKGWPVDSARLSRTLRRLAPSFRSEGIQIEFDTPKRRYITISENPEFTDITDMEGKTPASDDHIHREPPDGSYHVKTVGTSVTDRENMTDEEFYEAIDSSVSRK